MQWSDKSNSYDLYIGLNEDETKIIKEFYMKPFDSNNWQKIKIRISSGVLKDKKITKTRKDKKLSITQRKQQSRDVDAQIKDLKIKHKRAIDNIKRLDQLKAQFEKLT